MEKRQKVAEDQSGSRKEPMQEKEAPHTKTSAPSNTPMVNLEEKTTTTIGTGHLSSVPLRFIPSYTTPNKRVITTRNSVKKELELAMTLLQGLALP